jgi:hypothetical protein
MELYTWEYEGKPEYGFKYKGSVWVFSDFNGAWLSDRPLTAVTNLRPAKVVDADAVVIDEATLRDIKGLINEAKSYGEGDLWGIAKRVSASLFPTPPVTEPKGFGAIVEAQYYRATLRARFIFNGVDWIRERTLENHAWSDLINPTILSEGL